MTCARAVPPPPVPLDREAPWRIADFSKDAGVQRRMVFDAAFDTNNLAWFAASDGLYNYDGYRWKRFGIADGLPSSFIRTVTIARDGALWVGTDKGAGVFNGTRFARRGTEGKLAGPNIRRIRQTRDGALWFCCDRWPDATLNGGLTRIGQDSSRTYGVADGLPSDHVLDLFEQSNGRLIALTSRGPAVMRNGRWTSLDDPGFPAGDHTWSMVESPDGTVFAQASSTTMLLRDGQWRACGPAKYQSFAPLCVAKDGSVILAGARVPEVIHFERWDGQDFLHASSPIQAQTGSDVNIKSAPDGSIWLVGRGLIARWEYLPGQWDWWPNLPGPILEDRAGALWFADASSAVRLQNAQFASMPDMRYPIIESADGAIWAGGKSGITRRFNDQYAEIPEQLSGIARLEVALAAPASGAWFYGYNSVGQPALAEFDGTNWYQHKMSGLVGSSPFSATVDDKSALWVMLNDDVSDTYAIGRVKGPDFRRVPIRQPAPRTHLPRLCSNTDRLFLLGYNGLWHAQPDPEGLVFEKALPDAGGVFTRAATISGASAFLSQEGYDGKASILIERRGRWLRHPISYGQQMWLGPEGYLLVADGSELVLWNTLEWPVPTYISMPADETIRSMLRTRAGQFWLGTTRGALHLRPGSQLPETILNARQSFAVGENEVASADGFAPFSPMQRRARFSFSWRIDNGRWTDFGDWPAGGLPLRHLKPGLHTIEAIARDGLGNQDPSPARLKIEVHPVAIQDHRWFRPALSLTVAALITLSGALMLASRRLRRHAVNLERVVQARTAQLVQDIRRREQSEKVQQAIANISEAALTAPTLAEFFPVLHRVVSELMPAPNFYVALVNTREGTLSFPYFKDDQASTPPARKISNGLPEFVLNQGKPLLASGGAIRALVEQGAVQADQDLPESWLGIPLRTQHEMLGLMAVQCRDGGVTFSEQHRDLLVLLSYPVANAIERKQAEEQEHQLRDQLAQAQKMESVGRLAGGVAHDFNNMLQAILGNAALALQEVPPDSSLADYLQEIETSAQRSADLTRQLLAFARKQTISPRILDLNQTVSGMIKMLRRLIGEHIELIWNPGQEVWPVRMDPSQVDQILANLCVNARDAISGAGRVVIGTGTITLTETDHPADTEAAPGDYVQLSVTDNGHGMDETTQAHLFEPFFTTKAVGKGTGLGLATVFGIVKQNSGFIQVASERGKGTTFSIYLPRAMEPPAPVAAHGLSERNGGPETLLLVEDEAQVLQLTRRLLEQQGYRVLAAPSPAEALEIASTAEHIDLLVTDVVMPGMNGKALFEELRSGRPGLKCLFMSGYTADIIAPHGVLEEGVEFLEKPCGTTELLSRIRGVLGRQTGI